MRNVALRRTLKGAVSLLLAAVACVSVISGVSLSKKINASAKECAITFDANGGVKGATWTDVAYVPYGTVWNWWLNEDFITPAPGKQYDGVEIDGKRYAPGASYTITKDITAKALWKSVSAAPASKPGTVTNLKAVNAGKNKVKLTWDAVSGAEGYLVYAQKNGVYAYVGMTTQGTTFTDTKALDTDYNYYWVFAYVKNSAGKMIAGNCEKYVYSKGVCPAVPGLKAQSQVGSVKLSWSAADGADGYLVYGIRPGQEYGYIGMTTKGTTYTDTKASTSDWTFYWVFAYHKDANGKMIVGGTAKYVYGRAQKQTTGQYVTYKQYGAKGDGKTDDYAAIVATHEAANKMGLPVKADPGAVYYIGHMDPKNPKGALIKTDTDWGDAKFIIDDQKMPLDKTNDSGKKYSSEGSCFLFTVEPSKKSEKKWLNPTLYWRKTSTGYTYVKAENKKDGDIKIYLGLDPNLSKYKEYDGTGASNDPVTASTMKNKTFSKSTTKLQGSFNEKALYVLETESLLRWGRHGSATASGERRSQREIVIVNKDGSIDSATPLQWDWKEISMIYKYYIDETLLTVKGGTFETKANILNSQQYVNRGINVVRSNVLVSGVKHYLTGEDKQFNNNSKVVNSETGAVTYLPRLGAPYQGFFRLDHCTDVTLKDCVFSNHLRVFNYGDNTHSTAPYDFYAEYAADITLDHCTCAADGKDLTGPADSTGIMDKSRWGTTGTNYCKNITVQNGSKLSRIDAHMGTYNLTVKDSTLGCYGVAAVGFGTMRLERVTSYANYFISLRRDYGSAWYGDIVIKDCVWNIGKNYTPQLIMAIYDPQYLYGYDTITQNGKTYYCQLPTKITIDGFTLDASSLAGGGDGGEVLYGNARRGFEIYTAVVSDGSNEITQAFLNNTTKYKYPIKVTEEIIVKNFKVIKHKNFADATYKVKVSIRNAECADIKDEYFFSTTKFNYNQSSTTYEVAK